MKTASVPRRGQVYSVGNYLMTGKVLGKGHFARVEEATHRIIGKKVAIKIIDLTCIKEEYARRNLHREPRVMAKLRHPCIAALYETMMHGPRLYVVMEAAGGGDLCAHVLGARGARGGATRGLPEGRARSLASQLVSAVRHMHARGVVHRDLKMENIMLDSTKQFIKIVDFGLSNVWSAGGALRTPCGSLEYAAPELFVDGHRYGPEVDLWSIGVIVYGMVTGGLPFAGAAGAESRSRPQLRADIARGFARKQRAALAGVSTECKTFVQHLLEPNVDLRMKIEEAARHRWVKRPGMRMNTHPFGILDPKVNRETYKQISELSGQTVIDIVAQIKADPFGSIAGMYNIKTHLHQMHAVPGIELLWSSNTQELRPITPPEYRTLFDSSRPETPSNKTPPPNGIQHKMFNSSMQNQNGVSTPKPQHQIFNTSMQKQNGVSTPKPLTNGSNHISNEFSTTPTRQNSASQITKDLSTRSSLLIKHNEQLKLRSEVVRSRSQPLENPRFSVINKPVNHNYGLKKPVYKVYDNGDCRLDPRLPRINEHSNTDLTDRMKGKARIPCVRKVTLDDERRLNSCPNKMGDCKRSEFYRRAGDGLTNNIVSPHSSSNSHCKSERAMPVGWYSTRSQLTKETTHLQRVRRTVPLK